MQGCKHDAKEEHAKVIMWCQKITIRFRERKLKRGHEMFAFCVP